MLNLIPFASDGPGTPLLIVHGLFGSARNWNAIARNLSADRPVYAVDQRNHGESPWSDSQTYADMAADLAEVIQKIGVPVDVLGHSMGGKAAMVLALIRPELVRRLVIGDIAPVAYAHDNTQHIAAMKALDLNGIETRSEANRRLEPLVPDAGLRAFFLQSLDLRATGGPRWRLNLDVLERDMAQIIGWPTMTGHFDNPSLFLTGALSHYMQPEYREIVKSLFPKARFAKLPQAGHWLHADQPRAFEETVGVFLAA